jgi:hypothetical protein
MDTDTAESLAREYHERTEAFDRRVCTGGVGPGGGVLPANPHEAAQINRNAREAREDIMRRAERIGVSPRDMHRAIVTVNRP